MQYILVYKKCQNQAVEMDDFLYKPIGHTYTKSYNKHSNEKFSALQSQLFTSDPGWQLSKFLALPYTLQTERDILVIIKKQKPKNKYFYLGRIIIHVFSGV